MNMDFTLSRYEDLCRSIMNSRYTPVTVEQHLNGFNSDYIVIMRHDVDKKPENALKMAELEEKYSIRSTYYFRSVKKVFDPDIIEKVARLGHEIGFHYENLAKANGDYEKAIEMFKKELKEFKKIYDVKTICMHGSSLSKWDNRDMWKRYDFKDFGILGEAYLSLNFSDIAYFSDSGGYWYNEKFNLKDTVNSDNQVLIENTEDIIDLIENEELRKLCILSHPDRWADSTTEWAYEFITKKLRNTGKRMYKCMR